jgi:hypothetical protein
MRKNFNWKRNVSLAMALARKLGGCDAVYVMAAARSLQSLGNKYWRLCGGISGWISCEAAAIHRQP